MLAGLPAIYGLYASTLPLFCYALLGSSRQLSVAPVAILALMTAAAVGPLAASEADKLLLAGSLAMLSGLLLIALGAFRLGKLDVLLSHSVVRGFTAAAALIIAFSQVKYLLGIDIKDSVLFHQTLLAMFNSLNQVHLYTGLASLGLLAFFMPLRYFKPAWPGALLLLLASILLGYLFDLEKHGVAVLGTVPSGLPEVRLSVIDLKRLYQLMPAAVGIVLVGYMESMAIARTLAIKTRTQLAPNRELMALGFSNLTSWLVASLPVTGGLSRSAVNFAAGARTQLASVFAAVGVVVVLLLASPLIYHLPKAALAIVVINACLHLVDFKLLKKNLLCRGSDAAILLGTFVLTLSLGVELGIALGVSGSLLAFIWRMANPHVAVLGKVEGFDGFRNIDRYENAKTFPGVLMLRMDAPLYFINARFLEERVQCLLAKDPSINKLILDASGINDIDASGLEVLEDLIGNLSEQGVRVHMSSIVGPVRDVMLRSKFNEKIGAAAFHETVDEALIL